MKPTQLHENIAQQIDNMLPAGLVPGKDIGMGVVGESTLAVVLPKRGLRFDVRYDEGRDTYVLTRMEYPSNVVLGDPISDVYCDQLGELIFGDEAKPFSLPMVMISGDDGETWEKLA